MDDTLNTLFIELNGDRRDGRGEAISGGLFRIGSAKMMIFKSGDRAEQNPASLRRMLRLLELASQIRLPVFLSENITGEIVKSLQSASIAERDAAQKCIAKLANFPVPIVTISETADEDENLDLIFADGILLTSEIALSPHRTQLVKVGEIQKFPELIDLVSQMSPEKLLNRRKKSITF